MEIKVIKSFDEFEALKDKWNLALKKSSSNLFFLRHEWLLNWWKHYGRGHDLFVILVIHDGEIAAAAPMMILNKKLFRIIKVRKLQFIAHDVSDYMDFMIVSDHAANFNRLMAQIKSSSSLWDWAEFIYLKNDSSNLKYWRNIGADVNDMVFDKKDVSVIVNIGAHDSYDKYLRSLNKKVRHDVTRQMNNIEKTAKIKFDVYKNSNEILSLLPNFFSLHKKKWKDQKMASQFYDRALTERYTSLAKDLDDTGLLELSVLRLDNNIVAMHYGFTYEDRYYWYTPTYNPEYAKYSPGKLLLAKLIENAISRRFKIFDLLRGNEQYKYFWTKDQQDLYGVIMLNRNISSRIKVFMSKSLKEMLLKTIIGRTYSRIKTTSNLIKKES
ncbi:MAG: GNAT family N-acetyltransferase [Candidatus Margulisiibacteriota bacterium]